MIHLIKEKLETYGARDAIEEEIATREILQEIALYALWRAGFFEVALFQGGTSLRILHGLSRFSEDLVFMLRSPDSTFNWSGYLETLREIFADFGLKSEVLPRGKMGKRIRHAIIKDNSVASQLDLTFADRIPGKTTRIKLEIDVAPPPHSGEAQTYLDFPLDHQVRHQDLSSNFALKIHALLCRGFLKGRDWYDFSWYVSKDIFPNLPHLQAALEQYGPWANQPCLSIDTTWLEHELGKAICSIEWPKAAEDVRRFLRPVETGSLNLWSTSFFNSRLHKLIANAPDQ